MPQENSNATIHWRKDWWLIYRWRLTNHDNATIYRLKEGCWTTQQSTDKLIPTIDCRSNPPYTTARLVKASMEFTLQSTGRWNFHNPDTTIIQIKPKNDGNDEHDDGSRNINAEKGKYERITFNKNLTILQKQYITINQTWKFTQQNTTQINHRRRHANATI